jgi:hypothetical protein
MPMQIGMNARSPVGLPRTGMHGLDALQQGRVGRGAGGRWPLRPGIVTRLGHAEHACHRGNREAGLVRAHEPEEPDGRVPVSRANQATAFERISRSSRSCLFSRRSRVNSSRSNAVRPGAASSRRPSFRSAWATHARMEWQTICARLVPRTIHAASRPVFAEEFLYNRGVMRRIYSPVITQV